MGGQALQGKRVHGSSAPQLHGELGTMESGGRPVWILEGSVLLVHLPSMELGVWL